MSPSSSSPAVPPTTVRTCILCGTDFSESAAEAIDAAAALAAHAREKLLVVHSVAETFREQLPDEARDALIPILEGRLHAEAERARLLGATVEEAVLPGWPEDGIQERASQSHARLIVFGYPEFGALNRWLRGSVAETIAESSSIPTLVVHSAAPFERCVRGERPLRILVATDLALASEAPLRWTSELRENLPCEITIGYVQRAAGDRSRQDVAATTESIWTNPDRATPPRRSGQANRFHGADPDIRVVPRSAHIDEDLIRLAGEISADLLVVGTHQRHGLERAWNRSVSRELLRHAPISVACIPSSPTPEIGTSAIY